MKAKRDFKQEKEMKSSQWCDFFDQHHDPFTCKRLLQTKNDYHQNPGLFLVEIKVSFGHDLLHNFQFDIFVVYNNMELNPF